MDGRQIRFPPANRNFAQAKRILIPHTAGDVGGINLWAGRAYRLAEATPAVELVERWGTEVRAARF